MGQAWALGENTPMSASWTNYLLATWLDKLLNFSELSFLIFKNKVHHTHLDWLLKD